MVTLDYRTDNPRWGWSGIHFRDWENYSFVLGYLSNPAHYRNIYPHFSNADISLHIERNDKQGAWNKEGRIHYYGSSADLAKRFEDLDDCSSAGVGNITRRINSNGYILALISDFGFTVKTYVARTTADVFPPDKAEVAYRLQSHLENKNLSEPHINACMERFQAGYQS